MNRERFATAGILFQNSQNVSAMPGRFERR